MKKLMIGAAAALSAALSFGAGIASANVVGYTSKTLNWDDEGNQFTWMVNTLQTVGKTQDTITLKDFAVTCDGGLWSPGSVQVTTLGPDGNTIKDYCYVDQQLVDWGVVMPGTKPGWYEYLTVSDPTPINADDVVVDFRNGIMVQTDGCGAQVTCSGEVLKEAVPVTLNWDDVGNQFTWTGNCSPVDRKLSDFGVVCDGGLTSPGSVQVTTLGPDGNTIKDYCYVDQQMIDWGIVMPSTKIGWYEYLTVSDPTPVWAGDVVIKAGDAVMIQTDGCGASVVVPAAIEE